MRCRSGTLPNRLATVPRVCVSGKTGHLIRSYRRKFQLDVGSSSRSSKGPDPSLTSRSRSARARQVFSEAPPPDSEFRIVDVIVDVKQLRSRPGCECNGDITPTILGPCANPCTLT